MAEPQSMAQRIGLTRGKGVLIGVLAVALVGVLYVQYGPSDGGIAVLSTSSAAPFPSAASQAVPARPTTAEAINSVSTTRTDERSTITAQFDVAKWKPPELATVVAYDPFALPSEFPRPVRTVSGIQAVHAGDGAAAEAAAAKLAEAIESLQTEMNSLQQQGVKVIIRGRDQYVALIGDRTVHVGDEINGFVVTAIEADGVRVERKLGE